MIEVIIFVFSLMIASFVLSKYFSRIEMDEEVKYKGKENMNLAFWIFFFAYDMFFVGVILINKIVVIISLIILALFLIKELINTVKKINYYDKKFKLILKDDLKINKQIIKKEMVKDAFKNNFNLLSAPIIILEIGIKKILKIIFK